MKYVIAKCVGCGHEQKIKAGEVKPGDQPMCDKCCMPMVAKKAVVTDGSEQNPFLDALSDVLEDRLNS